MPSLRALLDLIPFIHRRRAREAVVDAEAVSIIRAHGTGEAAYQQARDVSRLAREQGDRDSAWLYARVAMRIGVALTVTLNLPFRQIGAANLAVKPNGTGTIALQTLGDTRISYLVCWPHVRPWHINRTQPALRAIPDAARVAHLLAEAAETRLNQPIVTQTITPAHAVAAE